MGGVLWGIAARYPLFSDTLTQNIPTLIRGMYSRGVPYVGCMGPSFVVGLTTVGVLAGGAGPQPYWLPDSASLTQRLPAHRVRSLGSWLGGSTMAGADCLVGV